MPNEHLTVLFRLVLRHPHMLQLSLYQIGVGLMSTPKDIIEINNLRLRCVIGFSPHERKDKQDVVSSLRIGSDMKQAGETDNPDDTLNYRSVTKDIIAHVESSTYNLVEKMASEIARIVVVDHGAQWVH